MLFREAIIRNTEIYYVAKYRVLVFQSTYVLIEILDFKVLIQATINLLYMNDAFIPNTENHDLSTNKYTNIILGSSLVLLPLFSRSSVFLIFSLLLLFLPEMI
jgi:hypothetical protein